MSAGGWWLDCWGCGCVVVVLWCWRVVAPGHGWWLVWLSALAAAGGGGFLCCVVCCVAVSAFCRRVYPPSTFLFINPRLLY